MRTAGIFRVPPVSSGDTLVVADSLFMREVVVAAAAHPMVMRGDTLVYDVASFPLAEGSRLRELLKRLPGVEVSLQGTVTAQGKVVTRIMLNGKDFFVDNKDIALDNLPVEILTEVKVYERNSVAVEEMGLQAPEKERVIDVTTKPDKNRGWFCDFSGAGGTEGRYAGNVSLSQFNDVWQNMISVAADNLPAAFGIGDSYYDKLNKTAASGDTDKQNYNVMVGRNNGAWEVKGIAYFSNRQTESGSRSLMESFLSDEKSYTNTSLSGRNRGQSFTSSVTMEWRDTLASVHIEPGFNYSRSRYTSSYRSYTYDIDPYLFTPEPLELNMEIPLKHRINFNRNESQDVNHSYGATLHARVNRRLSRRGRTLNVATTLELGDAGGESFSLNNVVYYRLLREEASARYQDNPAKDRSATVRLSYVEPLAKGLKLLLEYGMGYRYQFLNQPVYNLDKRLYTRNALFPRPIESEEVYSDSLSRFATSRYWNHRLRAMLQYVRGGLNLTAGLLCNPQRTDMEYRRFRTRIDTVRTVLDWSPEFSLYYRRSDSWNFTLRYAGESAQPDLLYLLPIPDDTDPLNVRTGNPGLRPSFAHTFSASYFLFDVENQCQISLSASSQTVQNAITQYVRYDSETGKRQFMPVNINGNRSINAAWSLGTSFRNHTEWYLECQGELGRLRRVGLQQAAEGRPGGSAGEVRYNTRQTNVQQYIGVQYRRGLCTAKPYGYFLYEGARSSLPGSLQRDVWAYGYGVVAHCEFDCGFSVAVDVYNHSRRGYAGGELNTDEFICDAEVSYSFLKGRAATVRLQASDLFRNRELAGGHVGLTGRSETVYTHSVNSYVLASFTYRFSLFGMRRPRKA